MEATVPVAVIIPTYRRGRRVFGTLERVLQCDPAPAEILVHVDESDGTLEAEIWRLFPAVTVLSSNVRVGPGGGRHLCIERCRSPYAASFDDDSYPYNVDFFEQLMAIFAANPDAAVVAGSISFPHQPPKPRAPGLRQTPGFVGCGHAIRVSAYRAISG